MMYWIGPKVAVEAAEAQAAAKVVGAPEYLDGQEVPAEARVTQRWAVPMQAADGRWAIPAYEGLTPEGVEVVDAVEWPQVDEA